VALTHDEVWCSVLHKVCRILSSFYQYESILICILQGDSEFPDKEELISRIEKKYSIVIESGENCCGLLALRPLIKSSECAFFVPISELLEGAVIPKIVSEREVIIPSIFTGDLPSPRSAEKSDDMTLFLTGPMDISIVGLQKSAFRCVLLVIYVSPSSIVPTRSFTILEPWCHTLGM
jgi:hypothetical protein